MNGGITMKFAHATITVRNMDESLKFYQEIVGLNIDIRISTGTGPEIVFLGEGETKVELIYYGQNKEINIGEDISLGFQVESLEDKMHFIQEKGIKIHSGPFQPNPTTKFFYVQDPNGLKIQFIETKL